MYYLFTMPNCGNCLKAKHLLDKNKIEYKELDVSENKENRDLANKYNVKMAGTIIDSNTGNEVDINAL